MAIQFSNIKKSGVFNWYKEESSKTAVNYLYPYDIDRDGLDEVLFAGFETQPNTPEEYTNTTIHLFGWKNNQFQEITSTWLPNGADEVEGVGDVGFGDFNADGLVDVFLSAYADMDYAINAYALINQGGYFDKVTLGLSEWEHGVFSVDLNNDGYQDIFSSGYVFPVSVYMGSKEGLTKVSMSGQDAEGNFHNRHEGYGSGVGVADFLGDGSVSAVVVDAATNSGGSRLIKVLLDQNNTPTAFSFIDDLPPPILDLPEWSDINPEGSHGVRAEPFDFNLDGMEDVLVFGRGGLSNDEWVYVSAVQFLENKGGGVFEDVTKSRLIGYDPYSGIAYSPVIEDFNGDGYKDIFLSEVDYNSKHNSTTFLIQENGVFVDTGRSQFSDLLSGDNASISTVAKGPGGAYYAIWNSQSNGVSSIFSAEIIFPVIATQDDANAIARLYLAAFDRLPDITGLNHWIDTYENGMAVKDIAANFYASAEFKAKYGDPADIDFISQLYSNVLDRDPDLGGLSNWQTALNEGTSRADVLLNFADSAENKANAAVYFSNMSQSAGDWSYTYEASISDAQSVARLYQSAFNRTPDEAGLNSWIDHFENGMSIKSIAKAFSESAEFTSLYGDPTDGEFVTLLYQNVLHRTPDAEGYSNNVNALSAISRVDLLVSFSESNESIVNTNSQFSGMYESGDIWYGF